MKHIAILLFPALLTGCAGSIYEAQNRKDAVEVTINGRVIRVIDHGERIELVRKGYIIGGEIMQHIEDFSKAAKQVTGCDVRNLVNAPGVTGNVWMVGVKDCNNK